MDISNLASGYGIQLEQKALSQFGAAVGNFSDKPGTGSLSNIDFNPSNTRRDETTPTTGVSSTFGFDSTNMFGSNSNGGSQVWQSPKYAADLVAFAPKHRFIFKVKFIFNDPYSRINREFMYVVKKIDKPKVTFEYEDINIYNFRTKVLKAIRHEPLSMEFHDDIQNKVLDFFNAYRIAYSPISSLDNRQTAMFEEAGMDFYAPGSGGVNSASLGILENGNVNVLSHLEVIQIYGHGTRQNVFVFTNPRIEQFDFDDLSHDGAEGNALIVSFNYDALLVKDEPTSGTPGYSWGASDILGNQESSPRSQFGNQLMGGDVMNKNSNGTNRLDTLGRKTNSYIDGFQKISSIKNVISSKDTSFLGNKNTLKSVLPIINQGSAKLLNKGLSSIRSSSNNLRINNATALIEKSLLNTISTISKSAIDLIESNLDSTLDNSLEQETIIT